MADGTGIGIGQTTHTGGIRLGLGSTVKISGPDPVLCGYMGIVVEMAYYREAMPRVQVTWEHLANAIFL